MLRLRTTYSVLPDQTSTSDYHFGCVLHFPAYCVLASLDPTTFRSTTDHILLRPASCHVLRPDSVAEPVVDYGLTVAVVDAELPV